MEPMKQCPQCGKYVPADRTYCMGCGTTLGVRCPDCRKVLPLGTKACPGCGHSFVRKRRRSAPVLLQRMKKHARPTLCAVLLLCTLLAVILCALPSLSFSLTRTATPSPLTTEWKASGFSLAGFFLGAHPQALTVLLSLSELSGVSTGLRFALYGMGIGWLVVLAGLFLSLVLLLSNLRQMGRTTARRLLPLTFVTLGGSLLTLALDIVIRLVIGKAAAIAWPPADAAEAVENTVTYAVGAVAPILLLFVAVLLTAAVLYLYLAVFRQAEENAGQTGEHSLPWLLSRPVVLLSRLAGRVLRRIRGGKAHRKEKRNRDDRTVVCTSRFPAYLALLALSLIFTQALLSKVSHIFFWFMLILPVLLLLYTLVARVALSVSMLSDTATTGKDTPYTYEFRLENHAPLAFPFIEAMISIPQSNGVRCTERTVRLAMAPLSGYHMKNTVRFRFRGTYDIGVRCFYVYDFFRLFRVQVPIESTTTVYVLPRRLSVDEMLAQSVSDSTARTVLSPLVVDKLEVSDIREYRAGDPLKSIHWKLSSKAETFMVKEYNTGTSNQTIVFCDLAAHFPDQPRKDETAGESADTAGSNAQTTAGKEKKKRLSRKERAALKKQMLDQQAFANRRSGETPETRAISDEELNRRLSDRATAARILSGESTAKAPEAGASAPAPALNVHELATPALYEDMNEYLADGVVELAIASVLAELHVGHEVLLLWFDRRSDTGFFAYPLRGVDEFERIYHLFGTAPLCAPEQSVTRLTAMVGDTESAKQLFVVPTLDQDMLSSLTDLPGLSDAVGFGSAEVLLYNPEERYRYPKERASYLESCREQLSACGMSLMISGTLEAPSTAPQEGGSTHE